MNFQVLTLFPEMIENGLNTSITGRAIEKGLLYLDTVNIRDFSKNKHLKVDDYPYGGGAGMVMQAPPIYLAYKSIIDKIKEKSELDHNKNNFSYSRHPRVIYLTPQGEVFHQKKAEELSQEENLIFLCGHYEGIDERVLELIVTDHISIGDYVLTGGELPAMVLMDTISRLVPGVLNNEVSSEFESLQDNLLEYPQYTRPEEFMGKKVPEVLLSGHHGKIEKWRREQSILRTAKRRPDLFEKAELTEEEIQWLKNNRRTNE